jgi:hypothetical protein
VQSPPLDPLELPEPQLSPPLSALLPEQVSPSPLEDVESPPHVSPDGSELSEESPLHVSPSDDDELSEESPLHESELSLELELSPLQESLELLSLLPQHETSTLTSGPPGPGA